MCPYTNVVSDALVDIDPGIMHDCREAPSLTLGLDERRKCTYGEPGGDFSGSNCGSERNEGIGDIFGDFNTGISQSKESW